MTRFAGEITAHATWLRTQHRRIPKTVGQALDMMHERCQRIYGPAATMTAVIKTKMSDLAKLTALEAHEAEMMDAEDDED